MINLTYPLLCMINAVPSMLQRVFQNEDHARQFIAGKIRFGLLQRYRKMEGCRQDETEGKAAIRWNLEAENPDLHNVSYSGSSLNPYYVLCTSHPAVCKCQLTKFGSFIVRINEPLILLERLCAAWKNDDRASSSPFITPVLYNKGDLVEPPPYFLAPTSLTYAQKPASARARVQVCANVQCRNEGRRLLDAQGGTLHRHLFSRHPLTRTRVTRTGIPSSSAL
jgi:hypothetical protein